MIMRNKKSLLSIGLLSLVAFVSFTFVSCRKDDFDAPPANGTDPNLPVNMTIDSLKNMYKTAVLTNAGLVTITEDWTIAGIVVADDRSGNLYKTINIEDGTGAMAFKIGISNYYSYYPVGTKIYVKLKGLVLGQYAKLYQMGGYIDNTAVPASVGDLASTLVSQHFITATYNNPVVPYQVEIGDLGNTLKWQNRLIQLNDVEIADADTNEVWADAVNLASKNITLTDCFSKTILIRTSGYCDFANELTPSGSGNLVALFTVYNTTPQLVLRDPSDFNIVGGRLVMGSCSTVPSTRTTIDSVRTAFANGSTSCPSHRYITGVVISDIGGNALDSKNCVVQDGTAGIIVRFTAAHTFQTGDSIKVEIGGQTLSEYNGLLEIGGTSPSVPPTNATKVGTGTITPRVVTAAQLVANMAGSDSWESTLVKVTGCTLSGGSSGTFSGSVTATDATGNFVIYTRASSTFSGTTYPTGTVTVTGMVSDFNGLQMTLRNAADVQ